MAERDVIIVGGGPAGLSAALLLGRCRRRVTLYDDGEARNQVSSGIHGFVSRDGIPPQEFRQLARGELSAYDVELRDMRVVAAARTSDGFQIRDASGASQTARKLLLATGVRDELPTVPGLEELYGRGIFPCPYCDGWEFRGRAIGAYAQGPTSAEFALGLTTWSSEVILFTDAGEPPSAAERARLGRYGIEVREERIESFIGDARGLRAVALEGRGQIPRDAVFFHTRLQTRSGLAEMLGVRVEGSEPLRTLAKQRSDVPGLYLAGDAAEDLKFAVVAAAHGARAAHDINLALRREDTP